MSAIRRSEYRDERPEGVHEVLDAVRYGHLATTDEEGRPVIKPLNFARVGEHVYFHRARPGEMSAQLGRPACLAVTDPLAWLPSTFRHPELACPATTYYRSVVVHGTPEIVDDPELKAAALEAFMRRYQPEGGYRPIRADDPMYRGPIQGVLVFRMALAGATVKLKVGQNLDAGARRKVFDQLLARGERGDARTLSLMARWDPALAAELELLPRTEGGLTFTDDPSAVPVDQLKAMFDDTYWAGGRSLDVIRRVLAGSYLTVAALASGPDGKPRLLGFARVVSDGALFASVHDVVVDGAVRGQGTGRRIMEHLLAHPLVRNVPTVILSTLDRMRFYQSFGFKIVGSTQARFGTSVHLRLDRGTIAPGSIANDAKPAGNEPREQVGGAQQLVSGDGAGAPAALQEPLGAQHGGQGGEHLAVRVGDRGGAPASAAGLEELRLDRAAGGAEEAEQRAPEAEQARHPGAGAPGQPRHA